MKDDMILRVTAKLLMPFMLLFALYVQFHGDYGPGGGFIPSITYGGLGSIFPGVYETISDEIERYNLEVYGVSGK